VTDGPPRLRRGLTRHRDNLDDLFRGKGGWRPRAEAVGQDLCDLGGEHFIAEPFGFHLRQRGGEGTPTAAPRVHRPTVQGHLARQLAVRGSRIHCSNNLGAPHKALGIGLTASDLL